MVAVGRRTSDEKAPAIERGSTCARDDGIFGGPWLVQTPKNGPKENRRTPAHRPAVLRRGLRWIVQGATAGDRENRAAHPRSPRRNRRRRSAGRADRPARCDAQQLHGTGRLAPATGRESERARRQGR